MDIDRSRSDKQLARELNEFYLRLDVLWFCKWNWSCVVGECSDFLLINMAWSARKGPGTDRIGGHLLKSNIVSKLWKQATVVPEAKIKHPEVLNDFFRPVALLFQVMKCFWKRNWSQKPPNSWTDYSLLTRPIEVWKTQPPQSLIWCSSIWWALRNIQNCSFIGFSSAFNTIQPPYIS